MTARYNGLADWYDATGIGWSDQHRDEVLDLLGPGRGRCLDLGCSTGQYLATLRETGRTVRPGGLFGVHPCFNGPRIENRDDGARIIHPTYTVAGWHRPQAWRSASGIRAHAGMRQVPLADFLNAFVTAGLSIERAVEPATDPIPSVLALRARRT